MTLLNELRSTYNQLTGATLYEMYKHFRIKNTSVWTLQSRFNLNINELSVFPDDLIGEFRDLFTHCNLENDWHGSKLKDRLWNAKNQVEDEIITCSDCGEISYRDDSIYIDMRNDWVGDCCRDNYEYHEGHDEYYHVDEYPEEDEDRYGVYPYDYDVTQQLDFQSTNNETRHISTEIETERRNDCPSDIVHDIHEYYEWLCIMQT